MRARAEELGPSESAAFERHLADHRERAALIEARTRPGPASPIPSALSVSSIIDYERCPKLFFWSQMRPLPRRPSPTARLGSEIHRWIELQSQGQTTLLDVDEVPDLSTEERFGEPGVETKLRNAFRRSRFATLQPLYAERPFLLFIDGMTIRGRIDAIFGQPEGRWEVVDYKTGRMPSPDDPLMRLQLDLYALACVEVWGRRPEDLKLTYFYLAHEQEVSEPAGDPKVTRARIVGSLQGIAAGRFDPLPGEHCRWCDFLPFCDAGRRQVGEGAT